MDGKPSLKGAWLGHMNHIYFSAHLSLEWLIISGTVNLGRRSVW